MENKYVIVLSTVPDEATGRQIATALVNENLAACCNLLPGVRSIYRWQGKTYDEQEWMMFIKSRSSLYEKVEKRILELHQYDVPEILALPVNQGLLSYLNWMDDHVEQES